MFVRTLAVRRLTRRPPLALHRRDPLAATQPRLGDSASRLQRQLSTGSRLSASMSDEQRKAQTAQPSGDTIFGKMVRKEIPVTFIYEDDQCVAIDDINPVAPVHFLVIPKKPIQQLSKSQDADEQVLGHLLVVARKVAEQKGIAESGYRTVINDGRHGCQSVYHLHIHVLGGKQLGWPPC